MLATYQLNILLNPLQMNAEMYIFEVKELNREQQGTLISLCAR